MASIVRILSVEDTRQYEEQGDRWVPIPGSGVQHRCGRCGRDHEIHALVLLDTREEIIVGTACMKAESTEAHKQALSLGRAAQRKKSLSCKISSLRQKIEVAEKQQAEILALALPVVSETIENPRKVVYEMGDAWVHLYPDSFGPPRKIPPERMQCLISFWRDKRARERGYITSSGLWSLKRQLEEVQRQLTRSGG